MTPSTIEDDSSSSAMSTAQRVAVSLGNGQTSVEYVIRGLRDEEIGAWAQFCASVFSYKANPPTASYFERHYYNDPDREANLVRVILTSDTNQIVSSCRIFRKKISIGSNQHSEGRAKEQAVGLTPITSGGIGEVCTSPEHRRRGLSKILLRDAIQIMKKCNMQISLLHAAPDFFPVYERGGGYASTISEWSVATIQTKLLATTSAIIRQAEFPRDTKRLQKLHQEYSERRFAGCVVRSEQYWNEYLSKELDGTLYVLERKGKGEILSWMALRRRGNCFQVREFGCDPNSNGEADRIVGQLLQACLADFEVASVSTVDLHLPTFLLNTIGGNDCAFIKDYSIREENDLGWMYVTLQEGATDMVVVNKSVPHLIWPSDSF